MRVATMMAGPDRVTMFRLAEDRARGEFAIPVTKTFPLSEAALVHHDLELGELSGKVVLIP